MWVIPASWYSVAKGESDEEVERVLDLDTIRSGDLCVAIRASGRSAFPERILIMTKAKRRSRGGRAPHGTKGRRLKFGRKRSGRTVLGRLGMTFSWKRLVGITRVKQKISRKIGIPLTKQGRQRKVGRAILRIFGL